MNQEQTERLIITLERIATALEKLASLVDTGTFDRVFLEGDEAVIAMGFIKRDEDPPEITPTFSEPGE